MKSYYSIADARKELSGLIQQVVVSKQSVFIMRHGQPLVVLSPFVPQTKTASLYPLRGQKITIADDFDDELTELWSDLDDRT
jgi:antitoxin (DNA-binding transcriptional repressor) of toxin-antitoxin stability system